MRWTKVGGVRTRLVELPAMSGLRLIPFLFALALVISCSAHQPGDPAGEASLEELLAGPGPKTVAVLPFEAPPGEPDIGPLVRTALYSHLSPRNYHDVEPARVDRLLLLKAEESEMGWQDLSPAELGFLFQADFLIYGRVLNYKRTFLGIYSQIVLTVGLEMVCCTTGESVWQKTLTRRSHDGGIPFSAIEIVPAALRSGLHMKHNRTVGLVDRVSRELAAEIPEPPLPLPVRRSFDLQVASFLDPEKADMAVRRFEQEGTKGRIEPVSLDGRVYHRVLLGPFSSAAEAEKAKTRIMEETAFRPILIHGNQGE
ncbi:MAG: SPOR domain-containing protein [Thermodesulfobacteriota bacterium]